VLIGAAGRLASRKGVNGRLGTVEPRARAASVLERAYGRLT